MNEGASASCPFDSFADIIPSIVSSTRLLVCGLVSVPCRLADKIGDAHAISTGCDHGRYIEYSVERLPTGCSNIVQDFFRPCVL